MDDRDKDLTHLFVRDLDEIPLPPRGAWRRAPRKEHIAMRTSRSLLTAGAAVAVLALALVVGLQLRDRTETVAAPSPSPIDDPVNASATSGPPGKPSATPTGASLLSDRFGVIVAGDPRSGTAFEIRTETGSLVGEFTGFAPAVSPDGRQVAVWQGAGTPDTLRLLDPTRPGPVESRTVLTLPASERGAAILWAPDGTALVVAVYSKDSFEGTDGGPKIASLRTVSLTSGTPLEIARLTNGRVLVPVAWDQRSGTVGAAESGAGGFMSAYEAIPVSPTVPSGTNVTQPVRPVQRTVVDGRAIGIQGSPDGSRVLGVWLDENTVHIWPTADYGAAYPVGKGGTLRAARWRPGSDQVWWVVNDEVGWFIPQTSSSAVMYGGSGLVALGPFRPDGSAVVVSSRAVGLGSVALVSTTSIETIAPLGGGQVVGSVRLR